ncbi:hypothetical protein DIPPA_22451 [Diplonema papillatum]|nr:hypothetical protein DIPPA_22451 [Diplonema papillatum]
MPAVQQVRNDPDGPLHYIGHRKWVTLRTGKKVWDAADEETERARLEKLLQKKKKAESSPHVIRGTARTMLMPQWIGVAEMWYKSAPRPHQDLMRKTFRQINSASEPQLMKRLAPASAKTLTFTGSAFAVTSAGGEQAGAKYETLAAQVGSEDAKALRRARLMLKLYLSPVLQPAYHERAYQWALQLGPTGEETARTVFGGMAAFTGLRFTHYQHAYEKRPDGGSVVEAARKTPAPAPTPTPARTNSAAVGLSPMVVTQPSQGSLAGDPFSFEQSRKLLSPRSTAPPTAHWVSPRRAQAEWRPPLWRYADDKGLSTWTTTAKDHYGVKPLGSSPLLPPQHPGKIDAVTASFSGCMPRALSPLSFGSLARSSAGPRPSSSMR